MRFITLLCCLLAASMVSFAQAKDMKVGTVDLKKIFQEYPGYEKAQAKFKGLAEKKQKELSEPEQDLTDLQKEIETSGSVMSAKDKQKKTIKYKKMLEAYAQQKAQIQNDLANKEAEMTQGLLDEIKGVVAQVAKDMNVDLVLDSEKTVYVRDGVDLTDAMLKKFKTLKVKDDDDSKKDDSKK